MNKRTMTAAAVFGLLMLSPFISTQASAADEGFGHLFTNEAPPALGGRDPLAGQADVAESTTDMEFFNIEPAAGDEQPRTDDPEAQNQEEEMSVEDPLATSEN